MTTKKPTTKTTSTKTTSTKKTTDKKPMTKTTAAKTTTAKTEIDYKSLYEQTLQQLQECQEKLAKFITPMNEKATFKDFEKCMRIMFNYNDKQTTNRFKIYISQTLICDLENLNAVSAKEYMAHFKNEIDSHNEKNGTNPRKCPLTKEEIKEYYDAVKAGDTEKENTFYY